MSHRDDSILQLSSPPPFPFRDNAYILSIRFVGIMAPSGTSRSSFSARGAEFHERGGRREIFPGKRNKIRHAFLFDLPRFPTPRHPLPPPPSPPRHYLPLTSFSGLYYFLPSTMARLSHSLSLILSLRGRDRQSFPGKEASESIFRVNQAPPTPDVSSLAR